MNRTDEILNDIKETLGMEIINKSNEGIPLFDIPYKQPFKFNLEIVFNSIKGMCSFQLHFPSLYIKANDITAFTKEVNYVSIIIEELNKAIQADYSPEWVQQ